MTKLKFSPDNRKGWTTELVKDPKECANLPEISNFRSACCEPGSPFIEACEGYYDGTFDPSKSFCVEISDARDKSINEIGQSTLDWLNYRYPAPPHKPHIFRRIGGEVLGALRR